MTPSTFGWGLLALYALILCAAFLLGLWSRRVPYTPPEVPPAEERPHVPRSVRDRLAIREADAVARRLHAREVHALDQAGPR